MIQSGNLLISPDPLRPPPRCQLELWRVEGFLFIASFPSLSRASWYVLEEFPSRPVFIDTDLHPPTSQSEQSE